MMTVTTWVLLIFLGTKGGAVRVAEFETVEKCKYAAENSIAKTRDHDWHELDYVRFFCVPGAM